MIDTLLCARWVIPVVPRGVVLDHHAIAITDGKITAILPTSEALKTLECREIIRLENHVLAPGLVNTHTHAAMSLLKGLADDLPLNVWLEQHIWPAEGQHVDASFVADGVDLAILSMLRSGTTCFNDMYFFPEVTAQRAEAAGMRAMIGLMMIDFPTAWGSGPEEYLAKSLALHDIYKHHPLINCAFAPHAPYTVSDEPLEKLRVYADELDRPVHMHVHETAHEISNSLELHHCRPLARLDNLGLVSPNLLAVHMTQLTDEEISLVAERGVHVVHCPESNLKLASGICPVQSLLTAGINVSLGTDGEASNNDQDMIGEMRTAALLGKITADDAAALSASEVLSMATINGARALGLEEKIGSLEVGKSADIIALDFDAPELQPVYDPISHIVYAASREQVNYVWVAGKCLLAERKPTQMDTPAIIAKAQHWQEKIRPNINDCDKRGAS